MKFPRQNKKKVTSWVGMTLFILWSYKKRLKQKRLVLDKMSGEGHSDLILIV
jgi:hypothetical protein